MYIFSYNTLFSDKERYAPSEQRYLLFLAKVQMEKVYLKKKLLNISFIKKVYQTDR